MELVNHAQRSLSEQTARLDPDNQYESNKKLDLEKSFMNVVVASGKEFEVQPFASMEIPRQENYRNSDYDQFRSDLDHYITQLILSNRLRAKGSSVEILPEAKDKIRSYVHGLRDCIEKANIEASKRESLIQKLNEFEKELEKRRTNLVSLAMIAIAILGAPGGTWASLDLAHKLVTNITQVFAEAKQTEDQKLQIGRNVTPKVLSPPRPPEKGNKSPGAGVGDLDDEIPF